MNKGHKCTFSFRGGAAKQKCNKKHLAIKGGALRTLAFSSFIAFSSLVALTVHPLSISPISTEAISDSFVSSTLTFDSINSVASVSLNVSSPDGSFATSEEDQKASFSISTNNYTGYTLMIRSNSDSTDLTDGVNRLSSVADAVSYDDFNGVGRVSSALNNKWGYLPNYYRDGDVNISNNDVYLPAPTAVATTLRVTDSANSSNGVENADIYTIGLGVRADYANPKGVYTFSNNGDGATFVLEYVANPINYIVNYADNTGDDAVTGLPETQAGNTSGDSIRISSDIPTRGGFEFVGWCVVEPVLSNGVSECIDSNSVASMVYLPGDKYNINQTTANDVTLYALWRAEEVDAAELNDEIDESEDKVLLYDLLMDLAEGDEEENENSDIIEESVAEELEVNSEEDGSEEEEVYYVRFGDEDDDEKYTCWRVIEITEDGEIKVEKSGMYDDEAGVCVDLVEEESEEVDEEEGEEEEDLMRILSHDTVVLRGNGSNDDPWMITEYQIYEDIMD